MQEKPHLFQFVPNEKQVNYNGMLMYYVFALRFLI